MKTFLTSVALLLWWSGGLNAHDVQPTIDSLNDAILELQNHEHDPGPPPPCPVCPPPDPDPDPDPTPPPQGGVPDAINNMAAGTWLEYGQPWDATAPYAWLREIDPGAHAAGFDGKYSAVTDPWVGWVRDGLDYAYLLANGGHDDGFDNGVYRYDIQNGVAETLVPHATLNAGLAGDYQTVHVVDASGNIVQPASSHTYFGKFLGNDGKIYHIPKGWQGNTVFSFDPVTLAWTRLPDLVQADGRRFLRFPFLVPTDNQDPTQVVGLDAAKACVLDLLMPVGPGKGACQGGLPSAHASGGFAWDNARNGYWNINPNSDMIAFIGRDAAGVFTKDVALSGPIPASIVPDIGSGPGICVIPDGSIIVWSKSNKLHRFDGVAWLTIDVPGPAVTTGRKVYNKWSWDGQSQTCIGTASTNQGLWVYKPVLGSQSGGLPDTGEETDTADNGEPPDDAGTVPSPVAANFDQYLIDIDNLPSIGGVPVAVKPFALAAWDEPVTRAHAGSAAPDIDALCAGSWTVRQAMVPADLTGLDNTTDGVGNLRVYVHALHDSAGEIVPLPGGRSRARCTEFIGVPDAAGRKPQIKGNVGVRGGVGMIVRGLIFSGGGQHTVGQGPGKGDSTDNRNFTTFAVMHGNEYYGSSSHVHFFGNSRGDWPRTYVEMVGNISAYSDSHTFYAETSIGQFIYKGNVCFGPARSKHCFKNLAHASIVDGNVFSNADIDGSLILASESPTGRATDGSYHPLDLYACTDTAVTDNTIIFRTTNDIRNLIAYRGRGAWGNCDKGRRLTPDTWEYMPPLTPPVGARATLPPAVVRDYGDPAFWADVASGVPDTLFSHRAAGNKFIVIPAFRGNTSVSLARVMSLRPIVKDQSHAMHATLKAESLALAASCGDPVCYEDGASPALRYAYDALSSGWQSIARTNGKVPAKLAIAAPSGWRERYALHWEAGQAAFMCAPDGTSCQPWAAPMPVPPAAGNDALVAASPPRVVLE